MATSDTPAVLSCLHSAYAACTSLQAWILAARQTSCFKLFTPCYTECISSWIGHKVPTRSSLNMSLTACSSQADAGRQVFPAAPAFTAAARPLAPHKLHLAHQFDCLVPRWTSPGPAAYAAAPAVRHPLLLTVSYAATAPVTAANTYKSPPWRAPHVPARWGNRPCCQLQARGSLTSLFGQPNVTAASEQAQRSAPPFGWSERGADARTYAVAGALPECLGGCSPGPAYECVWSPTTLFVPHFAFIGAHKVTCMATWPGMCI